MFKEERAKSYRGIAICIGVFILGQILLNWISIMEDPILGNTFYIIAGNLLMACSIIGIGLIVRHLYRLKKKERRKKAGSRVVFLDDEKKPRRASYSETKK